MRHRQRPAAVLLLSLLLMASIAAATITISTLIASTYKQSVDQDRFLSAGLGADTGVERSLAIVKAGRTQQTLDQTLAAIGVLNQSMAGGTRYSVTAQQLAVSNPTTLQPGQTQSIDLLRNGAASLPDHLELMGGACANGDSTCGGTIQVAWSVVTNTGLSNYIGRSFITIAQYNNIRTTIDLNCVFTESNNSGCMTVPGTVIGYRITVSALNNPNVPVRALVARPCIATGGICTTYSDASTIVLNAVGNQGQAQATKQAQVLWQLPSSGIFNFVIFTEGSIIPPT